MTDSRGPIIRGTAPFLLPPSTFLFLFTLSLSLSLRRKRERLSEITSRVSNRKIIMPRLDWSFKTIRTVRTTRSSLPLDVRSLSLPGVPANQRWITMDNSKKKEKAEEEVEDPRETLGNREEDEEWYRSRSRRFQLPENWKTQDEEEERRELGRLKCRVYIDRRKRMRPRNKLFTNYSETARTECLHALRIVRCLIFLMLFQKHWRRKDFANCPNTFHVSILIADTIEYRNNNNHKKRR